MTHLSEKLDDTHKKVEEMHAILLQANGARWVIVGLAGVAGLASGLVAKFMPWSGIGRGEPLLELAAPRRDRRPSESPFGFYFIASMGDFA